MKTEGIVLGAGFSSRAKGFKMTRCLFGKPVIEYVIDNMLSVCDSIIIVTGYEAQKIEYLQSKYKNTRLVFNANYQDGMFSSVLTGIKASSGDRLILSLGDCPAISIKAYEIIKNLDFDIVVPEYKGALGHPVALKRAAADKLLNSSVATLRDFLFKYGFEGVPVDDPAILMDIDYPEDFHKIESYLSQIT